MISLYLVFGLPILNLISGFLVYLVYTRFIFKTEFNDYLFGYLIAIVCLLIGALYVQDLTFGLVFLSLFARCGLGGFRPYSARPYPGHGTRTQSANTNPRPPADELATLHHPLFRQRSSRHDPVLPLGWTRCYGLAEKPNFIAMEGYLGIESKMDFFHSAGNGWLYFSFSKTRVFTAIVASGFTV